MAPKSQSSSSSGAKKASLSSNSNSLPTVKTPKPPTNYITRPTPSNTADKYATKVYFSQETLKVTGLVTGDIIHVSKFDEASNGVLGLVAVSNDLTTLNVAQLSKNLRKLGGIYLGDRIIIEKIRYQLGYAKKLKLAIKSKSQPTMLSDKFKVKIGKLLNEVGIVQPGLEFKKIDLVNEDNDKIGLVDVKVIDVDYSDLPDILSLTLDSTPTLEEYSDDDSDYEIEDIEEQQTYSTNQRLVSPAFLFDRSNTEFDFLVTEEFDYGTKYTTLPQLHKLKSIGGLKSELSLIKNIIKLPLNKPKVFQHFNVKPSRGVLLYGPSGTGKTLILDRLRNDFFNNVHMIRISGSSIVSKYLGDAEQKLRQLFNEAKLYQPCMIFIDELDSLVPNRGADIDSELDANDNRIIATLLTLMDSLENSSKIIIIGATNRPNNIDISLRRPGRFDKEIEIGIPDADARLDILKRLFETMNSDVTAKEVEEIAAKTHGYVGADLVALCRESVMIAIQRAALQVSKSDIDMALNEIRPSAMREIFLEMPKVRWSDIGGQEDLKRKLKEMVQLPLEASETFKNLGVNAPKGVLLYGPPGCSKTLTAKALATESGLNFLAVKGPEIFNKYVGESERSIREIFRKARAASPSIIFFDEIDALSPDRMSDGSSTSTGGHVLTTLLNEIDGVEELNGVIIVGATNKPCSIDPALLRPGRLDRHIYVGPPDYEGRLKILQMRTKSFNLQDPNYLQELAQRLEGCSGAEVVLVCQEAGIAAIMENQNTDNVSTKHFEAAMATMKKGITPEMLRYYNEFSSEGTL